MIACINGVLERVTGEGLGPGREIARFDREALTRHWTTEYAISYHARELKLADI